MNRDIFLFHFVLNYKNGRNVLKTKSKEKLQANVYIKNEHMDFRLFNIVYGTYDKAIWHVALFVNMLIMEPELP